MERIWTIDEICEAYKISRPTFYAWIKRGLKITRIGGLVRIKDKDLEEFINNDK